MQYYILWLSSIYFWILFDKESTEGIAGDAVTAASYESIDETDPEILEEKVLSAKGKSVDAR